MSRHDAPAVQAVENPDETCEPEGHQHPGGAAAGDAAVVQAARMFRAVGDEGRLRLMALLARGEACVTELAAATGEGLSTISQRLRVLRVEGLVVRRREGKHLYYALADEHVTQLILNALAHAEEG